MTKRWIKRAKKLACVLTAALVLTGTFPVSSVSAQDQPAAAGSESAGEKGSYAAYRQTFEGYPAAKEAIALIMENTQGAAVESYADRTAAILPEGTAASWSLDVPENAFYTVEITYMAAKAGSGNLEVSLRLDGNIPFEDVTVISLPRLYAQ